MYQEMQARHVSVDEALAHNAAVRRWGERTEVLNGVSGQVGGQMLGEDPRGAVRNTDLDAAIARVGDVRSGIAEAIARLGKVAEKLAGPWPEEACNGTSSASLPVGSLRRLNDHLDHSVEGLSNLHRLISLFEQTL